MALSQLYWITQDLVKLVRNSRETKSRDHVATTCMFLSKLAHASNMRVANIEGVFAKCCSCIFRMSSLSLLHTHSRARHARYKHLLVPTEAQSGIAALYATTRNILPALPCDRVDRFREPAHVLASHAGH